MVLEKVQRPFSIHVTAFPSSCSTAAMCELGRHQGFTMTLIASRAFIAR